MKPCILSLLYSAGCAGAGPSTPPSSSTKISLYFSKIVSIAYHHHQSACLITVGKPTNLALEAHVLEI